MKNPSKPSAIPLYYEGKSLSEMEGLLRNNYLHNSGWLDSAECKMATRGGDPLPWFTYSAISFLEQIISPNLKLFEYGGGNSTIYWAKHLRQVVSIDHDQAFTNFICPHLPTNAELRTVQENAALPGSLRASRVELPNLIDPERTERTYRSGQLNLAFRTYALQLLEYRNNHFDIVVIDGMARILSTWAAIQHFENHGFIVFDNSDRDIYRPAYEMLEDAGYRRLDFWGLGPVNPYEWCTSIFYQYASFTSVKWFDTPSTSERNTDPISTESRSRNLGILVLGYNRPYHLQSVLESLRLQNRLGTTHVWIDGTQGRGEYAGANTETLRIARRYAVHTVRDHRSHLGIEKMMLDALEYMTRQYDRILVLEDDCFPLEGSVDEFEEGLTETKDCPQIYSVYGHHFGFESPNRKDFSRFQGWSWAAHSDRIRVLLPELRQLFSMDEQTYCAHIAAQITDEVRSRLDTTPGRDVLKVLERFFSWDSATAFLTARDGLNHRRTRTFCVKNTGLVKGIGHFNPDRPNLRVPPFNMITLEEAWQHYDRTTLPCCAERVSYGLDELDIKLLKLIGDQKPGFFVEVGAYDGITQSNSVLLEKHGWTGLLVEANPGSYARCCKSRPKTMVEHAACVSATFEESHIALVDVGLMSLTTRSEITDENREDWIRRGESFTNQERQEIRVPAIPLSALLDKRGVCEIDLLLLDVEGSEVDVLNGLDFSRHAPRMILAEDTYGESIASFLAVHGYKRTKILLERKFTRDCFYQRDLVH